MRSGVERGRVSSSYSPPRFDDTRRTHLLPSAPPPKCTFPGASERAWRGRCRRNLLCASDRPHFNFPDPALDVPIVDPSAGPERRLNFAVSNGQKVWCAGCGRLGMRRAVVCCSPYQGSADVDRPLPGCKLGGSLWLSGQLKNRGLLTLTKERQQQDLAAWKFERIVMGHWLFFVDLPKDRCSVVEHILPPAQWTDQRGRNFASKGSVPGRTQTATPASSEAANPRVPIPKSRVVSLSAERAVSPSRDVGSLLGTWPRLELLIKNMVSG